MDIQTDREKIDQSYVQCSYDSEAYPSFRLEIATPTQGRNRTDRETGRTHDRVTLDLTEELFEAIGRHVAHVQHMLRHQRLLKPLGDAK